MEKKEYTQFSCKMNKDMLEQVKRNVLDYDLKSVSSYMNDCIKYALKNMKIEGNKKIQL